MCVFNQSACYSFVTGQQHLCVEEVFVVDREAQHALGLGSFQIKHVCVVGGPASSLLSSNRPLRSPARSMPRRLTGLLPHRLIGLGRLPDGIDSDHFARFLLDDPYRTFFLPGSSYDQHGHIRLGVGGGATVNLEKGLMRLAQGLRDYPRS